MSRVYEFLLLVILITIAAAISAWLAAKSTKEHK